MMFKNSMKLLSVNFSTVWKLLFYMLIVSLISVGLISPFAKPILEALRANDFALQLEKFMDAFSIGNMAAAFSDLFNILTLLLDCTVELFTLNIGAGIYLAIMLLFVVPMLFGFSALAVDETLYTYMSSQTRISFSGAIIKNFKKSLLYQLAKTLIVLPINMLILFVMYKALSLSTYSTSIKYFAPLIATMATSLLIAIKYTIFAGWGPTIIACDKKTIRGLKKGIQASLKKFFRALSTVFIIVLCFVCLYVLFGFIAFIIILPLGSYLLRVFSSVMFFTSQGMRYYVDEDTIVTPLRLEEVDSFKRVKDII